MYLLLKENARVSVYYFESRNFLCVLYWLYVILMNTI